MKVGAINEMTPAYREINPVDNKNIERTSEKIGALQVSEAKEPVKPEQVEKKPEINDGRETIGVSRDGDIAKASKEGLENISEGLVLRKTPEAANRVEPPRDDRTEVDNNAITEKAVNAGQKAADDTAANKTDKAAEETASSANKANSLLGYSKSELERLYLQGDISSNQLNKELERRDEIRGEKKEAAQKLNEDEKKENKTNEEIAGAREENRESGVRQAAAQQAEVTNADKAAGDKQVQNVQEQRQAERTQENTQSAEESSDETRKQIITEEMVNDEQFTERMSVLAGAERNDEIVSEALDTAVENDRLKMMEQILNVDPAMASNV